MMRLNVPKRLWDYGLVYDAEIMSRISTVEGSRTGFEFITGITPDIMEWLDFPFYAPVWYWDTPSDGTSGGHLGR